MEGYITSWGIRDATSLRERDATSCVSTLLVFPRCNNVSQYDRQISLPLLESLQQAQASESSTSIGSSGHPTLLTGGGHPTLLTHLSEGDPFAFRPPSRTRRSADATFCEPSNSHGTSKMVAAVLAGENASPCRRVLSTQESISFSLPGMLLNGDTPPSEPAEDSYSSAKGTTAATYWDWDTHVAALMAQKAMAPTKVPAALPTKVQMHEAHEQELLQASSSSRNHNDTSIITALHSGLELGDTRSSTSSSSTVFEDCSDKEVLRPHSGRGAEHHARREEVVLRRRCSSTECDVLETAPTLALEQDEEVLRGHLNFFARFVWAFLLVIYDYSLISRQGRSLRLLCPRRRPRSLLGMF